MSARMSLSQSGADKCDVWIVELVNDRQFYDGISAMATPHLRDDAGKLLRIHIRDSIRRVCGTQPVTGTVQLGSLIMHYMVELVLKHYEEEFGPKPEPWVEQTAVPETNPYVGPLEMDYSKVEHRVLSAVGDHVNQAIKHFGDLYDKIMALPAGPERDRLKNQSFLLMYGASTGRIEAAIQNLSNIPQEGNTMNAPITQIAHFNNVTIDSGTPVRKLTLVFGYDIADLPNNCLLQMHADAHTKLEAAKDHSAAKTKLGKKNITELQEAVDLIVVELDKRGDE